MYEQIASMLSVVTAFIDLSTQTSVHFMVREEGLLRDHVRR